MENGRATVQPALPDWLMWGGMLFSAYLASTWYNWDRTLIGTEVWALYYAGRPLTEQLAAIRMDLVHPPLIYLVERAWLTVFSGSDNAAKALPLVINLPIFFLFPLLAGRVTPHWRLASFLFLALYFRPESTPNQVRMYGLGLLLVVIALLLWDSWLREPRTTTLVAWTACVTLLVYTHLFGVLLVAAFVVANWLLGSRKLAFTAAGTLAGLTFLPWFLYVLPVYESRGLTRNIKWVTKDLRQGIADFFFGLMGGTYEVTPSERIWLTLVVMVVHVALLGMGIWAIMRLGWPRQSAGDTNRWFWTTAVLAGFPFLLALAFSLLVVPSLHWRFLMGIFPAYWLLVILIGQHGGRSGKIVLYGVLLPWALAMTVISNVRREYPSKIRQAAVILAQEQQPADLLLCEVLCERLYWQWNRWLGRDTPIEYIRDDPHNEWLRVVPQAELGESHLAGMRRVWFVGGKPGRSLPPVSQRLAEHGFHLERNTSIEDIVVEVYSRGNDTGMNP